MSECRGTGIKGPKRSAGARQTYNDKAFPHMCCLSEARNVCNITTAQWACSKSAAMSMYKDRNKSSLLKPACVVYTFHGRHICVYQLQDCHGPKGKLSTPMYSQIKYRRSEAPTASNTSFHVRCMGSANVTRRNFKWYIMNHVAEYMVDP